MKAHTKLTAKWKRFADEYLIDLDGTAAYFRAGYKAKNNNSAHVLAGRLLQKVTIKEYIEERQAEIAKKAEVTVEELILKYKAIIDNPNEKTRDRLTAMRDLGEHLGMFKLQLATKDDGTFPVCLLPVKQKK